MLGQTIRGANDVEALINGAVFIRRCFELLDDWIVRLLGMQHILRRTLDGFVVLGKWPIGKRCQGREDSAYPFRNHDERAHVVFGVGVHFKVGHIHQTCLRSASQGFPAGSQDARLYSTRRFAGHDHAQFW